MQALTAPAGGRERNAAVLPLPAFSDNYIWAIVHGENAAVVDPGEAGPVLKWLEQEGLRLRAILLTHHHGDHVGGVLELSRIGDLTVYGPARERLPRCDVPLSEGDRVVLPELDLDLQVLDVPGHTAGHIAYTGRAAGIEPVLFCGDTLFAGGCGRLFEGTPAQMHDSLEKFSVLPPDTQVFLRTRVHSSELALGIGCGPRQPHPATVVSASPATTSRRSSHASVDDRSGTRDEPVFAYAASRRRSCRSQLGRTQSTYAGRGLRLPA